MYLDNLSHFGTLPPIYYIYFICFILLFIQNQNRLLHDAEACNHICVSVVTAPGRSLMAVLHALRAAHRKPSQVLAYLHENPGE